MKEINSGTIQTLQQRLTNLTKHGGSKGAIDIATNRVKNFEHVLNSMAENLPADQSALKAQQAEKAADIKAKHDKPFLSLSTALSEGYDKCDKCF